MRGKVASQYEGTRLVRITPAYAGKSVAFSFCLLLVQDHPRLCGEKLDYVLTVINFQGSPPPMRGKATGGNNHSWFVRITPAYAGKSRKNQFDVVPDQDHPRLCGEKFKIAFVRFARSGSPPPMRGKAVLVAVRTPIVRDHPRLCGEKGKFTGKVFVHGGSPPPMRGKVTGYSATDSRLRITPAYAGKSFKPNISIRKIWDHPRLCGEKLSTVTSLSCM